MASLAEESSYVYPESSSVYPENTEFINAAVAASLPAQPAPAPASADALEHDTVQHMLRLHNIDTASLQGFHDLMAKLEASKFDAGLSERVDRKTFQNDCQRLKARMREKRRFLLNPRSRRMQYWDMTTMLALVFTATVTPFEVCLGIPTEIGGLWLVNTVINVRDRSLSGGRSRPPRCALSLILTSARDLPAVPSLSS
jgi:hypothetical protein